MFDSRKDVSLFMTGHIASNSLQIYFVSWSYIVPDRKPSKMLIHNMLEAHF